MPRRGLNIPLVTALDDAGKIIESDQRRIIHYAIHQGRGADSLFISGTTGEYNRLTNKQRQRLLEISVEEIERVNALLSENSVPVEAWVGVTAETKAETLANLELAVQLKAAMAVIAPFAISDLARSEIVDFFERDVAERIGIDGSIVIGLYDNPDIAAASNGNENLPLPIVKSLRNLPFVACLKASTTRKVLQNYLGAFAANEQSSDFVVYAGNAGLIFETSEMQRAAGINRQDVALAGVVSGTANLLPCEWKQAWQAVERHEAEKMIVFQKFFVDFENLTNFSGPNGRTSKLIGGIKQAMYSQGIISSPCVAAGTPALTADEAEQLNDKTEVLLSEMRAALNPFALSVDAFE